MHIAGRGNVPPVEKWDTRQQTVSETGVAERIRRQEAVKGPTAFRVFLHTVFTDAVCHTI